MRNPSTSTEAPSTAPEGAPEAPLPAPRKQAAKSRKTSTGQVLKDAADALGESGPSASRTVTVPGTRDVRLDLNDRTGDRLLKDYGRGEDIYTEVFLDWAPRLLAWWTDPDGVPVYRVAVHGQEGHTLPETLKDGTAWDQFEYAAGHDVRQVREALAGAVKVQRRDLSKAPGLACLGWHEIEDRPVYVSGGTCFGPAGEVVANVHAHDADEAALPPAPIGDRLREVVALSLSVLDVAVLRVSAPAMCSVWLSPLISLFGNDLPRFVPWMWSDGRAQVFGVLKSSVAAILQAHSGTGYRGESDLLPAADTTLPALSSVLGVRKDGLVIVDDYKPGETSGVDSKTQTTAEQGIRAATNRQARAKSRYKGPGLAKVPACMALLMYTAESLPLFNSGSTHDRTFPFQVHKGDVRTDQLTVLQDRVDDLPEAGAAYVAWLARNHATVRTFLADRFRELRADLRHGQEVTGRACAHIAHMLCAFEVFTRFAVEVEALTEDRRDRLFGEVRAALIEAATATTTERIEDQPDATWLRHLRPLFAGGKLYAVEPSSNLQGSQPTTHADALGWREGTRRDALAGYALRDGLAVVEAIANGEIGKRDKSLTIGGVQLRRLLAARGVIRPVVHRDGKHEHQHQIRVDDSRMWCPVIPWEVFLGTEGGEAPEGGQERHGGPEGGPACQGGCGEPFIPIEGSGGYHSWCDPAVKAQEALTLPTEVQEEAPAPVPAPARMDMEALAERARQQAAVRQPDDVPAPSEDVPAPRPARKTAAPAVPREVSRAVEAGPHAVFLADARSRGSIRTVAQVEALAARLVTLDDPEINDGSNPARLRVLAALEGPKGEHGPFAPYRSGRAPFWQAPMPGMVEAIRVSDGWTWDRNDYSGEALALDRNGAWPSAVSSVRVAHGILEHTGPVEEVRGAPRPGYYRVTVYPWTEEGIPSPLGVEPVGSEQWVTGPVMHLLADLAKAGRWPDSGALDSYTGDPARLDHWAHLMGELRRYALEVHGRDSAAYTAVKRAVGMSTNSLMGSLEGDGVQRRRVWAKCKARRMDWAHSVKQQAAVTIWRAADEIRQVVPPELAPLALRSLDELVIPAAALEVVTAEQDGKRPVVRLDDLGTTFGTWKVKSTEAWGE